MKVLTPIAVTAAILAANSVPETDYPEWDATVTYTQGAMVQKAATHRVYQSVLGGNKGQDPATPASTQWLDDGPTNAWAMFDQVVGTRTSAPAPGNGNPATITMQLKPGAITSLAVLDTNANAVRVQMTDSRGTVLYDRTRSSLKSGDQVVDAYTYVTLPAGRLQTLTFLDLPYYAAGIVTVSIIGPDPTTPVWAGTLLVGTWASLGDTETGGTSGFKDYSVKNTDDYGNVSVVLRDWSKQFQLTAMIDIAWADDVQRQVIALRGKPVLWLGEDGFDSLAVYGFATDFKNTFNDGKWAYVAITVEGLV